MTSRPCQVCATSLKISSTALIDRLDSKFNHDAPNVVHMTVKPQEMIDEEDAKKPKPHYGRDSDSNARSPGCRCVIL